ncbi:EscT/YscT/HrcT family type III secretion system export apparatus protein [Roseobacter weihaiensis]|uniref:EscT/YscT/HrcT family type III secretion system export apparatus protein n=1 Tax=Roseobacter weihaiensis TaxID=2763262 RepID=UPI001D0AC811|nr:flagellar biosynthetic protein FliR [Roseobacter sp. H9]
MTETELPFVSTLFPIMAAAKQTMIDLALASARFLGLVTVFPVFRKTELGRMFLAVLALAFALPAYRAIGLGLDSLPVEDEFFLVLLFCKEVAIGVALGLVFGVGFWAVQAVGELIDHQRSIGEAAVLQSETGDNSAVLSSLLSFAFVTLFVVSGGLQQTVAAVFASYGIWPIDGFLPHFDSASLAVAASLLGDVLRIGLLLAGPLLLMFFLMDLATILLGRLAGNVDVSMLLPAVKNLWFGVIILIYVGVFVDDLAALMPDPARVLDLLERIAPR